MNPLVLTEVATFWGLDDRVKVLIRVPRLFRWSSTHFAFDPKKITRTATGRITVVLKSNGVVYSLAMPPIPVNWPHGGPILREGDIISLVFTRRERWWQRWWRLLTGRAWRLHVAVQGTALG